MLEHMYYSDERNNELKNILTSLYPIATVNYILFKDCLGKEKKCSEYPNLRMHYVDVRELATYFNKDLLHEFNNCNIIINKKFDDFMNKIKDAVSNVGEYLNYDFFNKHITNINPSVRNNINMFINEKFIEYKTIIDINLPILVDAYNKDKDNESELNKQINIDLMASCCNLVFFMICLIMDKYTLLRMFRSFGVPRKTVNNRNIYSGRTKNIIFYGGNTHAKIYREFLFKYGEVIHDLTPEMTKDHINRNECNNCLNIDISKTGFIEPELSTKRNSNKNTKKQSYKHRNTHNTTNNT